MAVVDIGTNSTRLLIADVERGGLREHRRESVVTRLGAGVDATGELGAEAMERVHGVLGRYAEAMDADGCEARLAVMTSAVRDAANGAAFAEGVRARFGLDARTLSGDEEAELTFLGATATRDGEGVVVVDIGGGSTELVTRGFHVSTQAGVVRHSERHLHTDPPRPEELGALRRDVRALIDAAVPGTVRAATRTAVAVAGTPTMCAAIDLGLEPYDSALVEGHPLPVGVLRAQLERLAALPVERRRAIKGLHPDRAPTIVAGVAILLEVLDAFGLERAEASDRDLLWGAALRMAGAG